MAPENVTETSATLQAEVNPEGSETTWETYLECQSSSPKESSPCEPVGGGSQRHEGRIAASSGLEVVHAELAGLRPEYVYRYAVLATNSLGKEGWVQLEFATCSTHGVCPVGGFPGLPWWGVEDSIRSGEEAPEREAALEAKKKHEEEVAAHERAVREEGERAGRQAAEQEHRARTGCVVPRLDGDSLLRARKALRAAHCKLGRVTRPSTRGALVVARQGVRPGRRLAKGSAVPVKLARTSR